MTLNATRFYRTILALLLLVSVLAVTACGAQEDQSGDTPQAETDEPTVAEDDSADEPTDDSSTPAPLWASIELTDVQTGETFTVAEQGDGPVLLQAFAVW